MNSELKCCPCCGSRDVSFVDDWDDCGTYCMVVTCNNCMLMTRPDERLTDDDGGLYSEGEEEYDSQKDRIVDSWNIRSETAAHEHDVIDISEKLISSVLGLSNLKIPSDTLKNVLALDKKLKDLKDQMSREKLKLNNDGEVETESSDRTTRHEEIDVVDPF